MYGPASFYLVAAVFHVLAPSVLAMRVVWLVLEAIVAVEVLLLAWALGGRWAGCLAFALSLSLTMSIQPNYGYPAIPALATALAAIIALTIRNAIFTAGLFIGFTALFRHDFALYALLACVPHVLGRLLHNRKSGLIGLSTLILGAAAPTIPTFLLLGALAGLAPLVHQLLIFPATVLPYYANLPLLYRLWLHPSSYRSNPDIAIRLLALAAFLAVLVSLLSLTLHAARDRHRLGDIRLGLALALSVLSLALANHARFRFDPSHTWPLLVAFAPVLASAPFALRRLRLRLATGALAFGVLMATGLLAADRLTTQLQSAYIPLAAARARGIVVSAGSHYNQVIRSVESNTRAGEHIFSGATRHDRIAINDALIYFLSERHIPTAYHELNRGMVVTEPVQAEIVAALESHSVRLLVLLDWDSNEPNRSAVSSGITLLDTHIRTHFEKRTEIGPYQIWLRR
jgi:hypothetical protein